MKKNTANSKTAAQTIANAAPKSKMQLFAEDLNNFVSHHPDKVVKITDTDEMTEWTIDKGDAQFKMVETKRLAKTGRKCYGRKVYRVSEDGKCSNIEYGPCRKKYLYDLFHIVEHDQISHGKKHTEARSEFIKSVVAAVTKDKSAFALNGTEFTGKFNGSELKIVSVPRVNKKGKEYSVKRLFVDGVFDFESCQLNEIYRAMTKEPKRKKVSAEEAVKVIEDLV